MKPKWALMCTSKVNQEIRHVTFFLRVPVATAAAKCVNMDKVGAVSNQEPALLRQN